MSVNIGTRSANLLRVILALSLSFAGTIIHAQTDTSAGDDSIFPAARAPYQPMDSAQRWNAYIHENFYSPGAYLRAFGSSIGERFPMNPKSWPSGAAGYFSDVGSQFGRFTMDGTIDASLAAGLGYDPRYIACDCRGAFRRTGHAILRTFLTYNQDGERRFDLPGLAGIYGGSMLMMYWYPRGYSPLTTGVQVGNFSLGVQSVVNIVKEFNPEIKNLVRLRRTEKKQ